MVAAERDKLNIIYWNPSSLVRKDNLDLLNILYISDSELYSQSSEILRYSDGRWCFRKPD